MTADASATGHIGQVPAAAMLPGQRLRNFDAENRSDERGTGTAMAVPIQYANRSIQEFPMSTRFQTGPRALLAAAATVSALAVAAPAFAQGNDSASSNGTVSADKAPTTQTTPDAGASGSATNDNGAMSSGDNATGTADTNAQQPQKLPEPKSSDYGASNYHAPSDSQMSQFSNAHRAQDTGDTDASSDDAAAKANSGGAVTDNADDASAGSTSQNPTGNSGIDQSNGQTARPNDSMNNATDDTANPPANSTDSGQTSDYGASATSSDTGAQSN